VTFFSVYGKPCQLAFMTSCVYRPNHDFAHEGVPSDGMRDTNGRQFVFRRA
jgi:hypothetical protein